MNSERKKIILIAEDEPMYGKILKNKLEKEGFIVIVTQDGNQALIAARQQKPDIVLLDIMMPNKNGFQMLTEMKQDENLKDITMIVLSNLGQEEDINKMMSLGAADYLVKSSIQFIDAINKVKYYLQ